MRQDDGAAALAGFGVLTAAAALGGGATRTPATRRWYARLPKPSFTPPSWLFAPVWTVLYALIAWAGWRLWRAPHSPARHRALALWGLQLGLNAAWTPLFFGRRRPGAALGVLGLLLASVTGCLLAARRVDRAAAWGLAPYLGWSGYAFLLNEEIVRRR